MKEIERLFVFGKVGLKDSGISQRGDLFGALPVFVTVDGDPSARLEKGLRDGLSDASTRTGDKNRRLFQIDFHSSHPVAFGILQAYNFAG